MVIFDFVCFKDYLNNFKKCYIKFTAQIFNESMFFVNNGQKIITMPLCQKQHLKTKLFQFSLRHLHDKWSLIVSKKLTTLFD